ncbi:hypothetical protein [Streptomyces sp. A0642]|uniref:hypothetical protein n=1 Tax=Streptomyces sp. A0642 TaxID=2563100 RepID=UPI001F0F0456|nr:hypothetical protein [Streptomyces sp. A0642]
MCTATACSGSSASADAKPTRTPPALSAPFDAKNPATWTLPIQGYLPSDSAKTQILQAKKQLVSDCMKTYGFSWSPAPDLPRIGGKTFVDWRYGIHDLELAKKRGYKPDADEQAAYDRAMNDGMGETPTQAESQMLEGSGPAEVNGVKVPKGGCLGQADRRIDIQATQTASAQEISAQTFAESKSVGGVVKAFAAWSACMKEKGYTYAAPLDASDDPRFGSTEVTPEEIATATADIGCRDRTHVVKVWYDAERDLQTEAIEDKAEQLEQEADALDDAVKKAADVVAGTR